MAHGRAALILALAGAAAGVALAVVIMRQPRGVQPEVGERTPPATDTPVRRSRAELVVELALFEPPEYLPADSGPGENFLFTTALESYRSGDFDDAAMALRQITPTAEVLFYLGVSDIMSGRLNGGVAALRNVIDGHDPIYEEDARFFLSKALLYARDVAGARAELERVAAFKGSRASEAQARIAVIDTLPP
jgi:hypothetical protein